MFLKFSVEEQQGKGDSGEQCNHGHLVVKCDIAKYCSPHWVSCQYIEFILKKIIVTTINFPFFVSVLRKHNLVSL